jgi:hypothetical protein
MDCFSISAFGTPKYLEAAGLAAEEMIERELCAPEVEYQSRRAYVLAQRSGSV